MDKKLTVVGTLAVVAGFLYVLYNVEAAKPAKDFLLGTSA